MVKLGENSPRQHLSSTQAKQPHCTVRLLRWSSAFFSLSHPPRQVDSLASTFWVCLLSLSIRNWSRQHAHLWQQGQDQDVMVGLQMGLSWCHMFSPGLWPWFGLDGRVLRWQDKPCAKALYEGNFLEEKISGQIRSCLGRPPSCKCGLVLRTALSKPIPTSIQNNGKRRFMQHFSGEIDWAFLSKGLERTRGKFLFQWRVKVSVGPDSTLIGQLLSSQETYLFSWCCQIPIFSAKLNVVLFFLWVWWQQICPQNPTILRPIIFPFWDVDFLQMLFFRSEYRNKMQFSAFLSLINLPCFSAWKLIIWLSCFSSWIRLSTGQRMH